MKSAPVTVTEQELEFIQNQVMSSSWPWYWRSAMVVGPQERTSEIRQKYIDCIGLVPTNAPYFEHTLMERSLNALEDGRVNSSAYELFYTLFRRWCEENHIQITRIYRASINLVEHHEGQLTNPHTDHDFEHSNWLMYLNTVADAETVLFDQDFNIVHEQPALEYTAFAFPGCIHAHRLPSPLARRVVVVFTYN